MHSVTCVFCCVAQINDASCFTYNCTLCHSALYHQHFYSITKCLTHFSLEIPKKVNWQIVQTQIRPGRIQHLIRVSTFIVKLPACIDEIAQQEGSNVKPQQCFCGEKQDYNVDRRNKKEKNIPGYFSYLEL